MNKDLNCTNIADAPNLNPKEADDSLNRHRAKYQAELEALGASEETKKLAMEISDQFDSCTRCVYCDNTTPFCGIPYCDFVLEDLDIDACYDGVLRYLMKSDGKKHRRKS